MRRLALLLVIAFPALAQEPRLTLTDAVRAALSADPAAGAAAADVAAARAARGEAEAALKPHADVAASIVHYELPMVVTPIHGFTPGDFPEFDRTLIQSSLSANYLLYDGGAARARIRQADAHASSAAASADAAASAIAARTAALYLTILSRAATLAAHDRRMDALESELRRVRQLRDAGRAAAVEVLRVEAALAAATADRTIVAADLDYAERALARTTALPLENTRAARLADGSIDTSSAQNRDVLGGRAVEASPAVRLARERLHAQEAAVAFAEAGSRPRIQAVGSLLEFGSAAGSFSTEWKTGVQLRWSAFDGGATRQRIAQARAAVERAAQQVRLAEREVLDSIDDAVADFERARANAMSLAAAVERFEEVVRIEELRLDTGVGTQNDYLRAEADLVQVRAGLAAARYRSMIAAVEIASLTGELDADWLERGRPRPRE